MIASTEHGFCFVHIPKNGGSTIRDQLSDLDALNSAFHGKVHINGLGKQQKAHLPLAVIQDHFPEVFDLIAPLEKIVIAGDPIDRFLSAMSQRSGEVNKRFLNELSNEQLIDDFHLIIDHLERDTAMPAYEFRHFCRQKDFAYIDGQRFVEHINPLELMPELLLFLSERTGRRLDPNFHSNKTVSIKNEHMKAYLLRVKDAAKSILPTKFYGPMKDFALRFFAQEGAVTAKTSLESAGLQDFVRSFYASDFELLAYARENPSVKVQ